jgi:GTP-binding protein EngB required for normal cell division
VTLNSLSHPIRTRHNHIVYLHLTYAISLVLCCTLPNMGDASSLPTALVELHADQGDLIDTIDKLRSLGVGGIVDLPQIIVVGDQSSGKSSVLEAISQQKFPAKDGICTRFATELRLRKSLSASVNVSIEGVGSTQYELPPFDNTDFSNEKVAHIIEQAKETMSAQIGLDGVSEDILHIEVSGPDMVPLTLVDLPGFYHSETKDQSARGIAIVERLADRYMAQKYSIILTVVSGKYDIALQTVHNRALQHDPKGHRTMGIITKADFIRANSQFMSLAKNEEPKYKYGLGWHVLRNRTEDEADISNQQRDANEDELFQSNIWQDFPQKCKGIKALRQRLSRALYEHIKANMPGLLGRIRNEIKSRESQLERLGPARSSPQDLRQYLTTISKKFERLADDAIRGYYTDDFFSGTESEDGKNLHVNSPERIHKLRALVRDLNRVFYEVMMTKGHSRTIVDSENTLMDKADLFKPSRLPKAVQPWLAEYPIASPKAVPLEELMELIDERATVNRGTEFPGSINDALVAKEFKEQSSAWETIAERHLTVVTDISQSFVERLLTHIAGSDSQSHNSIMAEIVEPFFDNKRASLKAKLRELLHHYKYGFPQPMEAEFRIRMERKTQKRHLSLAQSLRKKLEGNDSVEDESLAAMMNDARAGAQPSHSNSRDVLEKMMVYYNVSISVPVTLSVLLIPCQMSRKIFIDNIIILAIENCLICQLPSILEPNKVNMMTDDKIRELVAESDDVADERKRLQKSLHSLNEGIKACRRHRIREPTGKHPAECSVWK